MVGTCRFELPAPRTPSECSTRLIHVPTQSSLLAREPALGSYLVYTRPGLRACYGQRFVLRIATESDRPAEASVPCSLFFHCAGGTNCSGIASPSPKKNCSICSTRNCCACGVQGCKRYSFNSIFCRSTHSPHAALETFL